jgi:hypothetical protein
MILGTRVAARIPLAGFLRSVLRLEQLPNVYAINGSAGNDSRPGRDGYPINSDASEAGPDPFLLPLEVFDGIFHARPSFTGSQGGSPKTPGPSASVETDRRPPP